MPITVNLDGTFDLRSDLQRMLSDMAQRSYQMHAREIVKELTTPNPILEHIRRPRIILEA